MFLVSPDEAPLRNLVSDLYREVRLTPSALPVRLGTDQANNAFAWSNLDEQHPSEDGYSISVPIAWWGIDASLTAITRQPAMCTSLWQLDVMYDRRPNAGKEALELQVAKLLEAGAAFSPVGPLLDLKDLIAEVTATYRLGSEGLKSGWQPTAYDKDFAKGELVRRLIVTTSFVARSMPLVIAIDRAHLLDAISLATLDGLLSDPSLDLTVVATAHSAALAAQAAIPKALGSITTTGSTRYGNTPLVRFVQPSYELIDAPAECAAIDIGALPRNARHVLSALAVLGGIAPRACFKVSDADLKAWSDGLIRIGLINVDDDLVALIDLGVRSQIVGSLTAAEMREVNALVDLQQLERMVAEEGPFSSLARFASRTKARIEGRASGVDFEDVAAAASRWRTIQQDVASKVEASILQSGSDGVAWHQLRLTWERGMLRELYQTVQRHALAGGTDDLNAVLSGAEIQYFFGDAMGALASLETVLRSSGTAGQGSAALRRSARRCAIDVYGAVGRPLVAAHFALAQFLAESTPEAGLQVAVCFAGVGEGWTSHCYEFAREARLGFAAASDRNGQLMSLVLELQASSTELEIDELEGLVAEAVELIGHIVDLGSNPGVGLALCALMEVVGSRTISSAKELLRWASSLVELTPELDSRDLVVSHVLRTASAIYDDGDPVISTCSALLARDPSEGTGNAADTCRAEYLLRLGRLDQAASVLHSLVDASIVDSYAWVSNLAVATHILSFGGHWDDAVSLASVNSRRAPRESLLGLNFRARVALLSMKVPVFMDSKQPAIVQQLDRMVLQVPQDLALRSVLLPPFTSGREMVLAVEHIETIAAGVAGETVPPRSPKVSPGE